MSSPNRAAVIGSPVAHSLSPVLHAAAYTDLGLTDYTYDRIELVEDELEAFLQTAQASGEWLGLSVTMPLKNRAFELMDFVEPQAQVLGVVNTVLFGSLGLTGTNTDVYGIIQSLKESGHTNFARTAVIGGGATAVSTLAALGQLPTEYIDFFVRSLGRTAGLNKAFHDTGMEAGIKRIPVHSADFARQLQDYDVIINTAPGTALDALISDYQMRPDTLLMEVSYADGPSAFAQAWEKIGTVVYGERMLLHQAFEQVYLFTGRAPNLTVMDQALQAHLARE